MECPYISENDKNVMKDAYISVLKKNQFNNFTSI